jgi:FKBP-type peptidyl-prolyl cis-trans isomerase
MTVRFLSAALAMTILSACSQGQKARNTCEINALDSVSYAIGADIGANLKRGKMDSLNVDLMAAGLQDGMDSTVKMDAEQLRTVMQSYMSKMEAKRMAAEQAEGEENRVAGEEFLGRERQAQGRGDHTERSTVRSDHHGYRAKAR